MPNQTITRAAESDLEPIEIFKVLAEVSHVPKWAPVFADAVERIGDTHYRVTKKGESFNVEVFLHEQSGTVDYIREMAGNKRGGAYIRVTPRPLSGSAVTMTVPLGPNANEAEVARIMDEELAVLIDISRRR
jgi:hypothetical protein